MRKQAVAALTALSMVLSAAPMVYARQTVSAERESGNQIYFHGEWVDIPVVDEPVAVLNDDVENVIKIYTQRDFEAISPTDWYSGKTIELYCDLDLSNLSISEWGGYIRYFDGELIGKQDKLGRKPIISGLPNNTALIYGMIGGTIKDIVFDHEGEASFIAFIPTNYSASDTDYDRYAITFDGVETTGYVTLTSSDQSNYSPFIYAANKGDFTMTNCVNNADMTGDIYGAVFHGYYALNTTGSYHFINCINNGEVVLRNAAMFFGNPSTMEQKLKNGLQINIENCENNGSILGTISGRYLLPELNTSNFAEGTKIKEVEDELKDKITGGGKVGKYKEESELTATINDDKTISIRYSTADGQTEPTKFVVTVGAYVSMWDTTNQKFDGSTARYSVVEEIEATEESSYTSKLLVIGFADQDFGSRGASIKLSDGTSLKTRKETETDNLYYMIDHNRDLGAGTDHKPYATNKMDEYGNPSTEGRTNVSFVTVSAVYVDDEGNETILAFVTLK